MTWNLNRIFKYTSPNDPKIESDIEKELAHVIKFEKKYATDLSWLETANDLFTALCDLDFVLDNYLPSHVKNYAERGLDIDRENTEMKRLLNVASIHESEMMNHIQFFESRLGRIPKEKKDEFLNSPILKNYRNWLSRLFKGSKHMLSEDVEKVLTLKNSVSYEKWVEMTSSLLTKQSREVKVSDKDHEVLSYVEIQQLTTHENPVVRGSATKELSSIYDQLSDVAVYEMNSILGNKQIDDELRGYDRPDRYTTEVRDNIDTEILDIMREQVMKRVDISHRFYELKAKLLGKERIKYNEKSMSIGSTDLAFPEGKGLELVRKTYLDLDPEFANIWDHLIENECIDSSSREGKVSGAYCEMISVKTPNLILTNYHAKLEDILTLAHEGGHAINFEMVKSAQSRGVNFYISYATTEVASTFFEDFVLATIDSEQQDKNISSALKLQKLNDDMSTIFRQVACYDFELELHNEFRKTNYLSREDIGNIFVRNMENYLGEAVLVGNEFRDWWIGWPHIRDFFYTYSYASGLLISKYLQSEVRKNPRFIEKVKEFLSAGGEKSVYDIFLDLGIDLRKPDIWIRGLDEIESNLQILSDSV